MNLILLIKQKGFANDHCFVIFLGFFYWGLVASLIAIGDDLFAGFAGDSQ